MNALFRGVLAALGCFGCSAGGTSQPLIVGTEGSGGSVVAGGSGGGPVFSADGSVGPGKLSAHFESPADMTVTFVTLSCTNQCADVRVVAKGGNPPYTYAWQDGATDQERTVCPTATTNYSVTAKDTAITAGEFRRGAQVAPAALTASVSTCPADAGTDAGPLVTGPCDSLAGGFSPSGINPNGPWSYGWSASVGAPFTLYPQFVAQDMSATAYSSPGFPLIAQWFDPANGGGGLSGSGPVPDIQFNPLTTAVHPGLGNFSGDSWVVGPKQVAMTSANIGGLSSVARWTAASAGTFIVRATFASTATPGFTQTSEVHVQQNGADLPSGAGSITATATQFAFSRTVTVRAGDSVDFVVAASSAIVYHMTSVDAEVCAAQGM